MSLKRDHKMEEAIELLQEAANDKKEDLYGFLGDEYCQFKNALNCVAGEGKAVLTKAVRTVDKDIHYVSRKGRATARQIKRKLKQNPVPFLIGTAVGFYLLSSARHDKKATVRRIRKIGTTATKTRRHATRRG